MLLGQLVAISVASNLFYAAVIIAGTPSTPSSEKAPPRTPYATPSLWAPVLIGVIAIALSPWTSKSTFLINLLTMHAVLLVPLLSSRSVVAKASPKGYAMNVGLLLALVLTISVPIRLFTVLNTLVAHDSSTQSTHWALGLAEDAWATLHSHPAQSSIGWDIIWTTVSFTAWVALRPKEDILMSRTLDILCVVLATPLASLGITAPYLLRSYEVEADKPKSQ